MIDKKICLQCLSLQSLSQLAFTVANKLTTKSVLCDSISFLPLYVGKCHNFKELHITILRLVLLNACFVPIFAFSFLSLSFHSPNLEPLEYLQQMLCVPIFNIGVCDKNGKRAEIKRRSGPYSI